MLIKHGNTSNILRFTLKHSTSGIGLTGLTSASAGLIIATICNNEATTTTYTQAAGNIETIAALGTYAAPTAGKCRFKEVDATNHKGLYEFQFADARFAVANARTLVISVTGATNLLDADYEIQLVSFNPYDAVRMGITALPNAAANAAGGLSISAAGGLDLDAKLANTNEVTAARMGALTDWIDGGRLDLLLDAIPTTAMRGTDNAALAATALTNVTWTDARAGYLNELAAANIPADVDTLLSRITAAVALASVCTEARLAHLDADISTRATPAQVNTEVSDVIKTDTKGEPAQGAPGATLSLEDKIAFMYKFLRNKVTNDGTTIKVYNDAEAVVDHKSTVSEAAGTVTRGEFASGP